MAGVHLVQSPVLGAQQLGHVVVRLGAVEQACEGRRRKLAERARGGCGVRSPTIRAISRIP
ncbi:hypothetical protein [Streptomyces sp. NPDC002205]|uniref:hypothetical protein n=1 Tax=unclassified Streptomyces TaxID=2593676 RepID=UPI003322D4DD